MPSRLTTLIATAVCGLAFYSSGSVHTQAKRAMTAVDLLNIPRTGDPQISPDGSTVAFTVSEPSLQENRNLSRIWVVPLAGGPARELRLPR